MIPLKADLPTRTIPVITLGLILVNILVYLFSFSVGPNMSAMFLKHGAIPYRMIHEFGPAGLPAPVFKSIFTSMFLHAGFFHVGGNMLYLWIFGNNVEDELGHVKFIMFYLLCGVIAAYSHAVIEPSSKVPMVGASGAVSGVLGAYFLLFPRAKILTLLPIGFFITTVRIPALVVIGLWVVGQLMYAFSAVQGQGGVAWFAHIGGFIAGVFLLRYFRTRRPRWQRRF
ncbi:MAG: rhomboid family intramembrane serine protease [Nitrospiria bacterium]